MEGSSRGSGSCSFRRCFLRLGLASATELYDLRSDSWEKDNRIRDPELRPLVAHLRRMAELHRNVGGHRLAADAGRSRFIFDWRSSHGIQPSPDGTTFFGLGPKPGGTGVGTEIDMSDGPFDFTMNIKAIPGDGQEGEGIFLANPRGIGVKGGRFDQVESGEKIEIRFNRDVIVESAAIVAGNGAVGGFYRMGDKAPLAIYCLDGDIDAQDQSGLLSDLGVLKKGEVLTLDSSPHYGVETPGQWRLGALTVRVLK